jgi:hypothetical protein
MKMRHPKSELIVDAGDRADTYASQGWEPVEDEAPESACPTCGAVGEEPCRTASGNEASEPHAARG